MLQHLGVAADAELGHGGEAWVYALGDLHLEPRGGFGDLIADEPITTTTWRAYLEQRAAANLARSTTDLRTIDPLALAAALPDTDAAAFVHLDAFAGNMLTDGKHITAILDIGPSSVAGDRRLDPLATAVYLTSREITPTSRPGDVDVIMSWLRGTGLDEWFEPMRRWIAAYWSFALDDLAVTAWSRPVTGRRTGGRARS